MSVNSIDYGGNLTSQVNSFRGPSDSLWRDCPVLDLLENPGRGMYFWDDFQAFPGGGASTNGERALGQWNTFIGNNSACVLGTAADTTNLPLEGGVLGLTAGSNNNLSISMAAATSGFRLISGATGNPMQGKLWFECSIAVSAVASGAFDLFVGLMDTGDAGTRITSAADLVFSAANTIKTTTSMGACLGFWKRATTNPADVCVVHNVNAGTAQVLGASGTIQKLSTNYAGGAMAALTTTSGAPTNAIGDSSGACFLKLGFLFDTNQAAKNVATALTGQTAGAVVRPIVQFFVNGKVLPIFYDTTIVQAATFPATFLAPVIGFRSGGTGTGIAYVDWIRCAQLGSR